MPPTEPHPIRVEIVSDVVCPWCLIGYRQTRAAESRLAGAVRLDITWHPFELNPDMPPQGQGLREHVAEKYGATPAQSAAARARISALGADLGFRFAFSDDSRIVNTFAAHQLLHWAETQGHQTALQEALFAAYFSQGRDVSDPAVLADIAAEAGLDPVEAAAVLADGRCADAVRAAEQMWLGRGINGVPAMVFEGTYLVSGAQSVAGFVTLFERLASGAQIV
ncbi:DsbA family oxidoreductase [Roseospira navarrensis]|uniref:DsbA family oxidoreductase n=1 Tax=Roseospira navarrensis TaxID=140058 RepID=A0A7X2D3Z9_9PROT|nr:DsbA family oxidoreductase [Roseospira navarrensis]MQX37914.1 DsbA family oxidoreductase [Roseospira navarrensis]